MLRPFILVVSLLFFLTGCQTSPRHIALDDKKTAALGSVRVVSMIPQDEIIARSKPSYVAVAVGGGLLAAMVDSSITKSRMSELYAVLEPGYASFDDLDLRAIFWPQLRAFMAQRSRLVPGEIVTTPWLINQKERKEIMAGMREDAYLEIYTDFFFDPNLRTFNIITSLVMYGKDQEIPTYKNSIYYQSPAVGEGMQDSMDQWTANGAAAFRAALTLGVTETMRQLELDLGKQHVDPSKDTMTLAYNTGVETVGRTGNIMVSSGDRVILREEDGSLVSLANVKFKKTESNE